MKVFIIHMATGCSEFKAVGKVFKEKKDALAYQKTWWKEWEGHFNTDGSYTADCCCAIEERTVE